ncbi:MAG: hypothetical protein ACN4GZ_03040 [Acidimicrobiales bacterium]
MFLWFVILAPVLVAEIFQSPMADYRVVAVGAALPLLEAVFGAPRYLHTMLFAMGLMAVVMLGTSKRRLVRRRLLGIPIGLLLHLVLDFTWADSQLLWWPAFGTDFSDDATAAFNRSLEVGLLLEVVAVAVGYWAYRRYELDNPENRDLLIRSGRLARSAMPG